MKKRPFDFVKSINQTKEDLMTDTANDEMAEKEYDPFIVNKALSFFPDTVILSNEMNQRSHLSNRMQFYFYLHSIRKKARFKEWPKKEKDSNIELIRKYFCYNDAKAQTALSMLTEDDIDKIKDSLTTGIKQ